MKSLGLVLFSTLLLTLLQGQIPDYFDHNPTWYEIEGQSAGACGYITLEHYYLDGDSIIDSQLYHRIIKQETFYTVWYGSGEPDSNCQIYDAYSPVLKGYYRQEGRRIFRYVEDANQEFLFRDFDWAVGDTVLTIESLGDWTVSSMDSVLFGSEYRRIYQLSGVNNYLSELVEGVGYNRGLFEWTPDQQAGIGENLHCYAQNGVGMYPLDSNCGSPLSLGDQDETSPLSIFPNPVADVLNIRSADEENIVGLFVYDLMGQLAIEVQVDERSSKQEIALSELSKGVYVLLVLFEDGSIGRHEVIKE